MMIRLIKSKFNDLKFRGKLLLSHLIIALIPILLLGMLSFSQSYHAQMKELKSEARSSMNQVASILDYKINRYNMLCEFLVLNREFSAVFLKDYGSNYFRMYLDFRDIVDPLIAQTKLMDEDIEEITFYTSGDLPGIRGNILPLDELKRQPWYDGYRGRHWIVYDGHVYLLQQLISNLKESNFMVITIDYDSIFSDLDRLSEHISVSIEGVDREPIYHSAQPFAPARDAAEIREPLKNIDWMLKYSLSYDNAYLNAMAIFKITFFVILLSLLITFCLIYIFSSNFTRRIVRLRNKVDKVEQNNLDVVIHSSSKDEVGELTNGIGKMLSRINGLIRQVYEAEIAKRESEYNQLITQINPHFLYNTLSFINWRAVKKQDIETSYMVAALAKFYRTTLNKGKTRVTLRDELDNIKAYIDLQMIMHDGGFEANYDIDEGLLTHEIIHFILQPIVENAIKHGFAETADEDLQLWISACRAKEELKLSVRDNGVGMSPERAARLLSAENGGCGVQNVNDRVKLYYGPKYGLAIASEPRLGTAVTITLPYGR
ncbi:sensor histidine kinase [Paenibacillus macerans]|uniref:sensor histidine kinase n=1 Tax=Paenibacillus macerans TaxID=44252 RepID=UPI003D310B66